MLQAPTEAVQGLLGHSAAIDSLRRLVEKASYNASPYLLLGETGTGKEGYARAVHKPTRAASLCPSIAAPWSAP